MRGFCSCCPCVRIRVRLTYVGVRACAARPVPYWQQDTHYVTQATPDATSLYASDAERLMTTQEVTNATVYVCARERAVVIVYL